MARLADEVDPFEELESAALQLSRGDRARLAERLLASLDEDPAIEQAWEVEIARRVRAYRAGEMRTYSSEEVDAVVEGMLGSSEGEL
jgi:putative addiction module component (TIGR02574 family)